MSRDWGERQRRVLCYRCGNYGFLNIGCTNSKYRRKVKEKGKKVVYGRYYFFYVSHYSPKRKRCYIPERVAWEDSFVVDELYSSACCSYHIETECPWPSFLHTPKPKTWYESEKRLFILFRCPSNDCVRVFANIIPITIRTFHLGQSLCKTSHLWFHSQLTRRLLLLFL